MKKGRNTVYAITILLQVVYVFHQLCVHEETRKYVVQDTDAVAYIIDLMHDKNTEVQRVCDRTLDIISQYDDSWSDRVQVSGFVPTAVTRRHEALIGKSFSQASIMYIHTIGLLSPLQFKLY